MTAGYERLEAPPQAGTSSASLARRRERPVAVRVKDLSVRLELQRERVTSLREQAIRFLTRQPVPTDEFWPLRNVTFEVQQGETLAIVGRNGAGKSTVLKVIAGVLAPTNGHVEVRGRIAPLLELGAGFDPEMTGRENVFLYGSMLGVAHRAIAERFDRIVEFSELAEFIDVPLKNYSTGMWTRLGFAVAIEVDADILIVDETLTVGDSRFQLKCMERIEDFRNRGATILFVSHNPDQVKRLSTRAVWIEGGRLRMSGPADEVLGAYAADEFESSAETQAVADSVAEMEPDPGGASRAADV
jgi:ABC-2 type transport system ATP-binding protein